MNTAVVLVTWNGASHLGACLASLVKQRQPARLTLVIDNASEDDTLDRIERYRLELAQRGTDLLIVQNKANLGFTCAANMALRRAMESAPRPDMIVLLNQDTQVDDDWLAAIEDMFARHENAGAVGCKIFYPGRGTLQHAGGMLIWPRLVGLHYGHHQPDAPEHNLEREVDFVTGAAIALRTTALDQVGLFNELFAPGYYEDVDLCMRLRANGWQVWYCPQAVLEHAESASFSDRIARLTLSQRNRLLFALMQMHNPPFEREFEAAEADFLRSDPHPDELRALSLAYGRAMLMARQAVADKESLAQAIDMLARLRHLCTDCKQLPGRHSKQAEVRAG
ncbi:MAG: glycosyltransferase family 2 protein [Anaerolineae bacterium]|nr:glycosyltransferase family 2 protein [Thermoflexales bacterium]MDW8406850.1 glycosyltransferase family 2 protein [Anaerolineae bacterium]